MEVNKSTNQDLEAIKTAKASYDFDMASADEADPALLANDLDSHSSESFSAIKERVASAASPRAEEVAKLREAFLNGTLKYDSGDIADAMIKDGFLDMLLS